MVECSQGTVVKLLLSRKEGGQGRSEPARALDYAALGLLAVTLLVVALTSEEADWEPLWLVLTLTFLTVLGDLSHARSGSKRLSVGLVFIGIAMALLGPAPAVCILIASRIIDSALLSKGGLSDRRFATVGGVAMVVGVLVGSLIILEARHLGSKPGGTGFALIVFTAICVANVVDFGVTAVWVRIHAGTAIGVQLRRDFVPAIPWLAAPNLLAGALATLYVRAGAAALVLALAVLAAFYVLMVELLRSRQRSEELEQRTLELASLQVGVLVTMVRTMSLRDRFTARHSAAVARYAIAIAEEAECSDEELRLVHPAGLLHDIGKFAFPDRILLASERLSDEDYELAKRHAQQGADLVRRVQGLEPVADIILAHHERIDGQGYPGGLRGDEIPRLARMISVADVYDVITGRDTYRTPVSHDEAVAELRRSAGTQLDAHYIELFIAVLERDHLSFAHAEDKDLEAELDMERHIRELALPRVPV